MRSKDKRECGVLLHISSLPSPYGIGTLGKQAYDFIDFLASTGQKYWQILPLVPVGEGNSPYKSSSCFAGEPLLIDLDFLVRDGLLNAEELPAWEFGKDVDYDAVRKYKIPLLKKATERFDEQSKNYGDFLRENEWWLKDYALFAAIADSGYDRLCSMPEELKYRLPSALEEFAKENSDNIAFHKKVQYFFFAQYSQLHNYAIKQGVKIVGDIPIYVSLDSADVWVSPDEFKLGRDLTPVRVAGVPPDIFSNSGQLWGNPVYDWDYQRKTGYRWWKRRLQYCASLYDVIRIDHFRAFESFYSIPCGAKDARTGIWEKGPAMNFWNSMSETIKDLQIIAEDLGGEEPEVEKLVLQTGFPNMKVLQFAFDKDMQNRFLPRNYERNCVCYTGTHDNDTSLGWWNSATTHERLLFSRLAPEHERIMPQRMIAMAMRSRARMVIIPMQDWLSLDTDCRMNTPGTSVGNWKWRMSADALDDKLKRLMRELCKGRE